MHERSSGENARSSRSRLGLQQHCQLLQHSCGMCWPPAVASGWRFRAVAWAPNAVAGVLAWVSLLLLPFHLLLLLISMPLRSPSP